MGFGAPWGLGDGITNEECGLKAWGRVLRRELQAILGMKMEEGQESFCRVMSIGDRTYGAISDA